MLNAFMDWKNLNIFCACLRNTIINPVRFIQGVIQLYSGQGWGHILDLIPETITNT